MIHAENQTAVFLGKSKSPEFETFSQKQKKTLGCASPGLHREVIPLFARVTSGSESASYVSTAIGARYLR